MQKSHSSQMHISSDEQQSNQLRRSISMRKETIDIQNIYKEVNIGIENSMTKAYEDFLKEQVFNQVNSEKQAQAYAQQEVMEVPLNLSQ